MKQEQVHYPWSPAVRPTVGELQRIKNELAAAQVAATKAQEPVDDEQAWYAAQVQKANDYRLYVATLRASKSSVADLPPEAAAAIKRARAALAERRRLGVK